MKSGSMGLRVAAVAASLAATLCIAQEIDVAAVIEGRQSNLRDLGAAYKGINDEFKKAAPSLPLIRQYAGQIDALARQQHFWFPAGSGPGEDVKTKAKPEIWSKPEQFAQLQGDFTREAAKFLGVVANGDLEAVKTQYRAVGKACAACHRQFRERDD